MSKVVNGTSYKDNTPDKVIDWLELLRTNHIRARLFYGKDGKCWNEEFDTIGTISRSTGTVKIPLLIKNSRSLGGTGIIDNCIVRIDMKDTNNVITTIYKDNSVKFDHFVSTDIGTVYNETKDILYARCKNGNSGKRLAAFMNAERWSK